MDLAARLDGIFQQTFEVEAIMLVAAKNRGNLARKDGGEWLTVEVDKKGAD
jgi:hypothetical protein